MFFAYKKLLGRTETRTHDSMYRRFDQLHLPRRSSKNCDLQFANADRQTLGVLSIDNLYISDSMLLAQEHVSLLQSSILPKLFKHLHKQILSKLSQHLDRLRSFHGIFSVNRLLGHT